jgi:hypothetical protein
VNKIITQLQHQGTQEAAGIAGLAGTAYATGGIAGALAAIKTAPNSFGATDTTAFFFGKNNPGKHGAIDIQNFIGGEQSTIDDKISTYDQLTQLMNSQTSDKGAQAGNLKSELDWLRTLPQTIARDQKIADLQNAIEQLTKSTDGLNSTNQDLLSPYYTQDPRTSHIGFRSQGMASGGWVDVPGAPSANDNMIAQIPVAGGERIFVDPNRAVRGGGSSGGTVINISAPMTFTGPANRDEVGRTVYQNLQNAARSLAAAR